MVNDQPEGLVQRLRMAVARAEEQGRSIRDIERSAGVSNAYLRRLLDEGRTEISVPHLLALSRALGVRLEWLVENTWPMLRAPALGPVSEDIYPARRRAAEAAALLDYPQAAIDAMRSTRIEQGAERLTPEDWLNLVRFHGASRAASEPASGPAPGESGEFKRRSRRQS